jgi:hypothetical protein
MAYRKRTCVMLRDELEERGLKKSGNKNELILRLKANDEENRKFNGDTVAAGSDKKVSLHEDTVETIYSVSFKVEGHKCINSLRDCDHGRTDYGQHTMNQSSEDGNARCLYSLLKNANVAAKVKFKELVDPFFRDPTQKSDFKAYKKHGRPPKAKHCNDRPSSKPALYKKRIWFRTNDRVELYHDVMVRVEKHTLVDGSDAYTQKNPYPESGSSSDDDPNENFVETYNDY